MSWSWLPSCSPDVVLYVLLATRIALAGWTPCPTEDDPARTCAAYDRSAPIVVAETPGLSMVDPLPTPAAGDVWLLTVEAKDGADNLSHAEASTCP